MKFLQSHHFSLAKRNAIYHNVVCKARNHRGQEELISQDTTVPGGKESAELSIKGHIPKKTEL